MNKKVLLMILDGWGKSPDPKVSAIANANTPFIDKLYTKYPNCQSVNRRYERRAPRRTNGKQ